MPPILDRIAISPLQLPNGENVAIELSCLIQYDDSHIDGDDAVLVPTPRRVHQECARLIRETDILPPHVFNKIMAIVVLREGDTPLIMRGNDLVRNYSARLRALDPHYSSYIITDSLASKWMEFPPLPQTRRPRPVMDYFGIVIRPEVVVTVIVVAFLVSFSYLS